MLKSEVCTYILLQYVLGTCLRLLLHRAIATTREWGGVPSRRQPAAHPGRQLALFIHSFVHHLAHFGLDVQQGTACWVPVSCSLQTKHLSRYSGVAPKYLNQQQ